MTSQEITSEEYDMSKMGEDYDNYYMYEDDDDETDDA